MNQTPSSAEEKSSLNWIERVLIWLSGAEESCLAKCPKWERRKYEAFGASVLVPVCFGMIGSAYAVSTLTDHIPIIVGFAMVWGFIILTIDRVLLATYRAFTSISKKITQFVLRLSVALLMGITVSHPLTLLLFKDTIIAEIEKHRTHEMTAIRADADREKQVIEERIIKAAQNLTVLQQKYEDTVAGDFVNEPTPDPTPSLAEKDRGLSDLDEQITALKADRSKVSEELLKWQQLYEDEVSGKRSGKPGIGWRAEQIEKEHIIWRSEEVAQLSSSIRELTDRRSKLSAVILESNAEAKAEIEAQRQNLQKQKLEMFASQQTALVAVIKDQIESAAAEVDRLRDEAKQLSADTADRVANAKDSSRADLMMQTMVLHEIFENPANGGHFALMVYVIIAGLFTLIDTLPLVVKFFSVSGPYDMVQHYEGSKYRAFHDMKTDSVPDEFRKLEPEFREQVKARMETYRYLSSHTKFRESDAEDIEAPAPAEPPAAPTQAEQDIVVAKRKKTPKKAQRQETRSRVSDSSDDIALKSPNEPTAAAPKEKSHLSSKPTRPAAKPQSAQPKAKTDKDLAPKNKPTATEPAAPVKPTQSAAPKESKDLTTDSALASVLAGFRELVEDEPAPAQKVQATPPKRNAAQQVLQTTKPAAEQRQQAKSQAPQRLRRSAIPKQTPQTSATQPSPQKKVTLNPPKPAKQQKGKISVQPPTTQGQKRPKPAAKPAVKRAATKPLPQANRSTQQVSGKAKRSPNSKNAQPKKPKAEALAGAVTH